MDFLVGTLILWGVTALIVQPVAKLWARQRLARPGYAYLLSAGDLDEAAQAQVDSLNSECFVITHVLVRAALGFVGGLVLASPLIGIARQRKYWPGIIALVAASFLGSLLAATVRRSWQMNCRKRLYPVTAVTLAALILIGCEMSETMNVLPTLTSFPSTPTVVPSPPPPATPTATPATPSPTPVTPTATPVVSVASPTQTQGPPTVTPVATSVPATVTPSPTSTPEPVKLGQTVTYGKWEVTCSSASRATSIRLLVNLEGDLLLPTTLTLTREGLSFVLVECTIQNMAAVPATYTLADIHVNSTPQNAFALLGIDVAWGGSNLLGFIVPNDRRGWELFSRPLEDHLGSGSAIFYLASDSNTIGPVSGKAAESPISVAPGQGRKRVLLFQLTGETENASFQFRDLPPYRLDE